MPQKSGAGGPPAAPDLRDFLKDILRCSAELAGTIAARAKSRKYPMHAIIIKQGDRSGAAFLLVAGFAHALKYGAEGQMMLLREFRYGDFFGAISQNEPSVDAEVVAVEASHAAMFAAFDFVMLVETHNCLGLALSRALIRQLHAADEKVTQRIMLSAAGRVYAELLKLARQGDGRTIRPAPVLAKVAVQAITTRESASRAVNDLLRRGLARREPGALVLVAPQRLEEMIV